MYTIELRNDGIGRLTKSEPFLLPDELQLEFKSKSVQLNNAFISLKNGNEKGQFKMKNPFVVPQRFLFGGNLEITIKSYVGETVIKKWAIVPIKLIETEYGIHAFDFLEMLNAKYNELFGKVNEIIIKHNKLEEHVEAIKENY